MDNQWLFQWTEWVILTNSSWFALTQLDNSIHSLAVIDHMESTYSTSTFSHQIQLDTQISCLWHDTPWQPLWRKCYWEIQTVCFRSLSLDVFYCFKLGAIIDQFIAFEIMHHSVIIQTLQIIIASKLFYIE